MKAQLTTNQFCEDPNLGSNVPGDNVRMGKTMPEDLKIIDEWRDAHRVVLNRFYAILCQRKREQYNCCTAA